MTRSAAKMAPFRMLMAEPVTAAQSGNFHSSTSHLHRKANSKGKFLNCRRSEGSIRRQIFLLRAVLRVQRAAMKGALFQLQAVLRVQKAALKGKFRICRQPQECTRQPQDRKGHNDCMTCHCRHNILKYQNANLHTGNMACVSDSDLSTALWQ